MSRQRQLQYTNLHDKNDSLVGSPQAVIATSIEIMQTAKDFAAKVVIAGGGCVVIVAGIDHVLTMMIAVNGMAIGIGDASLHLMCFCVMSHSSAKLISSLKSIVTLLPYNSFACDCSYSYAH